MSSNRNIKRALSIAEKKLLVRFMAFLLSCLMLVELAIGVLFFYDLYRTEIKLLSSMGSEYQRILKYDSAERLNHVLTDNPHRLTDNDITVFVTRHNERSEGEFVAGDANLAFNSSMTVNSAEGANWVSRFLLSPYLSLKLEGTTEDFWLVLDNQKRYFIAYDKWQMTFYAMIVMLAVTALFTQRIIHNAMTPLVTLGDLLEKLRRGELEIAETTETPEGLSVVSTSVHDAVARLHHTTTTLNTTVDAIAHDVRTPLTRILLSSQAALMSEHDLQTMKDALADCSEHATQASNMLTALMKLNDELVGKRTQQMVATDVADVVRTVCSWYEDVADQKQVELVVDADSEIVIQSDPDKLTQILVNLVDNAIKYTEAGDKVTVNISRQEGKGTVISVVDTGIGIDPKFQDLVFERLYRVDTSRSNIEGYGLGLSLAAAMAANLGGTIELSSRLNQGSTFSIVL